MTYLIKKTTLRQFDEEEYFGTTTPGLAHASAKS